MTPHLFGIRALSKSYQAGLRGCAATARVLDGAHLQIDVGEVVAIVGGPSTGKTTLLLCAAGLLSADDGSVDCGCSVDGRATRVAYFRDPVHLRVSDDADPWDLALVDNVDRVRGDVARAFALLSAIRRAHSHGAALVLASRDSRAVQDIADRLMILENGRLRAGTLSRLGTATARVAERRSVDRDSGRT